MLNEAKASKAKFFVTVFFATLMSVLFIFLGAPALRVLRNAYGTIKYWFTGALLVLGFWVLGETVLPGFQTFAILLAALWSLVGLYSELEEKGWSNLLTASLAVFLGSAIFFAGVKGLAIKAGLTIKEMVKTASEGIIQQIVANQKSAGSVAFDFDALFSQAPSAIIILMMLCLGFALMLDTRTAYWLGLKYHKSVSRMKLISFKAPDFLIWATMFSFLFSFVKVQPETINIFSSNLFNVLLALYFFQGLAVLEASFVAFNIGSFMRFLIYFLIVGQLFFLLSVVGIIDFWVDFRRRMKRLRNPENNRNGEHI